MTQNVISKARGRDELAPNLLDYEAARRTFSWQNARAELKGLPGGGLNIAYEAVDRHCAEGVGQQVAIRFLTKEGEHRDVSYENLAAESNRFANVLSQLGVQPGDLVCSLLGRVPALYISVLGTLKHRAVFSPLFSAFGPDPIRTRMSIGEAKLLITSPRLYARKVAPIRAELPALRWVVLVDEDQSEALPEGTWSYSKLMATASPDYAIGPTRAEDPALLHFTSGTTGTPKGALHVHEAVVMHHMTGRFALDLHPGDIFWCTADPGWVTGMSYGIIAPLTCRSLLLVDEAEFDVERWYDNLERERVTVFYTAPTAIRRLMRAGREPADCRDLTKLRFLASVGEPLNPEAVVWSQEVFGRPFHDNWWQTETGGIMIANFASMDVKPGSMGKPLPGIEALVVERGEDGTITTLQEGVGELALRKGWPSMFREYLNNPQRYENSFVGDLYLSGDLVQKDADGYFFFVGRADDVIKTAGHLVGPFEVESALMEHEAVAEAAVIGVPDEVAGSLIKAFVVLHDRFQASDALAAEIRGHARAQLGAAIAPREVRIVTSLPRTRSGKILRRLLKARELGLPEGDLSTLEDSHV